MSNVLRFSLPSTRLLLPHPPSRGTGPPTESGHDVSTVLRLSLPSAGLLLRQSPGRWAGSPTMSRHEVSTVLCLSRSSARLLSRQTLVTASGPGDGIERASLNRLELLSRRHGSKRPERTFGKQSRPGPALAALPNRLITALASRTGRRGLY